MSTRSRPRLISLLLGIAAFFSILVSSALALPTNPVVFVTQPPWPSDFTTVNATFGNHLAAMSSVPRGGDLYIRYPDGTLKNLTQAAGYGSAGMQGASAIAVRDPAVYWDASKVIFSMVVGAPTQRYQVATYHWQLYEITGLGLNETPVITKVPNQPSSYNNVSPLYGSDDNIIFTSDRPRGGASHLYPQRDEYESAATNTGLWKLNPTTGELKHLDHAPSGDFSPILDSFGRVIFTRWDHLQRDQQNRCSQAYFQAFNYTSESADASALDSDTEVYPEPRGACEDDATDHLNLHSFNHFLPWQINEDGTEMETLNHIGRQELVSYIGGSFDNDPNVQEYYGQYSRLNQNSIENLFQIQEDPASPGTYFGINAPEFGTHASGQIVKVHGPPTLVADLMTVDYVTHEDTALADNTPSGNHIGLSRDPLPLSDGTFIASHTSETRADSNEGSSAAPQSRYDYRLKSFVQSGPVYVPGTALTSGIQKTISFWSPDELVSYNSVTMWELQPKELRSRTRPTVRSAELPSIEQNVFDDLGIAVQEFKDYMLENSLALVVSRNLTSRDKQDRQQPRNLKVAGSETSTVAGSGKLYEIAHLQFFQGDQVRGYAAGGSTSGRRVLAQAMHDVSANPENPDGPSGSVAVAPDGSMAAFVPATRPLTYQLTDSSGTGVVRERFWLTFQPGEIRVCSSCHGVNSQDQAGQPAPTNEPLALRILLENWKSIPHQSAEFTLSGKSRVTSGKKFTLRVSGNSVAANKTASLRLKVKNSSCGEVRSISTDSQAAFTKSFKFPAVRASTNLTFNIVYAGTSKSTLRTRLLRGGAGAKSMTNQKLCRAIKSKLR
jgi:hypothetical protein